MPPIYRGNVSVVEIASVDTNPSKLPDTEPLRAGKIDTATTRCFDLLCVGKCKQGDSLELDIQPAEKIPNLVTKNANGDPVFAEPEPMCTIRTPKGHNVWVKVALQEPIINVSDYVALGIKKRGEDDYFDILHTGNLFRYVDVLETDVVELVPLASSTALPTYTAVKAGDTAKITNKDAYDFGSVYRVNIPLHNSQWLMDQPCDLSNIGNDWSNIGKIGVGSVVDQNGNTLENQLIAVNYDGILAHSSDGKYWTKGAALGDKGWWGGPVYGNGIWCAVCGAFTYGVKRSIDGGKNWSLTLPNVNAECIDFSNGLFMIITRSNPGVIYTSPDAEIWTKTGKVEFPSISFAYSSVLICDSDKWLCGSLGGYIYYSKAGTEAWKLVSDELYKINGDSGASFYWYGGCHINGYFYVIRRNGLIMRSSNGSKWEQVLSFDVGDTLYHNVTYYKNKLWAFARNGQKYIVGLFNPDGTI